MTAFRYYLRTLVELVGSISFQNFQFLVNTKLTFFRCGVVWRMQAQNFPLYSIISTLLFDFPNFFWKFAASFVVLVSKIFFVVVVSFFESIVCYSFVIFFPVVRQIRSDGCSVQHVFGETFPIYWTIPSIRSTFTVASIFLQWLCFSEDFPIVGVDHRPDISHAAITNFERWSIENFVEFASSWEVFGYESQEFFTDVCFYCLTVWRVKPYYISFPIVLIFCLSWTQPTQQAFGDSIEMPPSGNFYAKGYLTSNHVIWSNAMSL